MNKKLYFVGLALLILVCSVFFFACNSGGDTGGGDTEFIVTDYKTTLEITVDSQTFLFYNSYTEELVYSYQAGDDDEKNDETYEVKIDGDWYLYEKNSFGYWTQSLTEDPYKEEIEIRQEDFSEDADGYYVLKPEKLEYYSDALLGVEDMTISNVRFKFNDDGLPVEMLASMLYHDTAADARMTFEYNIGETFELPEKFVPSYNIKITTVYAGSQYTGHCWVFDNIAYTFSVNNVSGLTGGISLEIDVYGEWVRAVWYNNSWQYYDEIEPQSTGFNMINAMNVIDFSDFTQEGESLVLLSSKLSEYKPFILVDANPDTSVLSDYRIKVSNGQITEMTYAGYFQEGEEITDTFGVTLMFEYGVLTFEDLP